LLETKVSLVVTTQCDPDDPTLARR